MTGDARALWGLLSDEGPLPEPDLRRLALARGFDSAPYVRAYCELVRRGLMARRSDGLLAVTPQPHRRIP